jgi:SAM-dependent methyltransferase
MAGKLACVTTKQEPADREPFSREQRLVFGEIAEQYDEYRPSYPDALYETIIAFGDLHAGDRALEIGAGTGKATLGFVERGLDVHALEPSPGMAEVLRAKGIEAEATLFESYTPPADGFRLVYAAQAWHWVGGDDRYERAAAALAPGGTAAFFWNKGRDWTGALKAENAAAYAAHAPNLVNPQWNLDWVLDGLAACDAFDEPELRVVTWTQSYTRDEWVRLLGTHSDHRMLPEPQRTRLHAEVADVIDRHGGRVELVYDVECYLARKVSRRV